MLSFIPSSSPNSNAFALFVSETYEYKDLKGVLTDDIKKKVDLFLKALKARNEKEAISSLDISDKKKCFIIKIQNKYKNYYFEEIGGTFFTYIKKYKTIHNIDIYADSLKENKDKLPKLFSEFIFGFNLKSYTFMKYKTLNKEKVSKKISLKVQMFIGLSV